MRTTHWLPERPVIVISVAIGGAPGLHSRSTYPNRCGGFHSVTSPDELPAGPKSNRSAPPTRSSIVALVNQVALPGPVAMACHTCSGVPGARNSISTQRLPPSSFLIGM